MSLRRCQVSAYRLNQATLSCIKHELIFFKKNTKHELLPAGRNEMQQPSIRWTARAQCQWQTSSSVCTGFHVLFALHTVDGEEMTGQMARNGRADGDHAVHAEETARQTRQPMVVRWMLRRPRGGWRTRQQTAEGRRGGYHSMQLLSGGAPLEQCLSDSRVKR